MLPIVRLNILQTFRLGELEPFKYDWLFVSPMRGSSSNRGDLLNGVTLQE